VRLGDAGRHGPHAHLGDELHVDARLRVGVLQVVDELRQVLDRVDVVVRRRRDQADAGRRVPGLGHPGVHLGSGQLAALTRLGTLRHLDLDVVRVREVVRRHAEASRGHLLDRAPALRVAQAVRVLAALAGVGLAAEAVHRDREGLVRLDRDRAVGHRARGEPLDDLRDRLHLLDRHGSALTGAQLEEAAQRHQALGLLVHPLRVLLEDVVPAVPRGVLEPEHRLGVEQVRLTLAAPLVLATDLQAPVRGSGPAGRVRSRVARGHLRREHVKADAVQRRRRPREVGLHEVVGEADRLEHLRAAVRGHGGDAHLAHDLEHALAERLDEVRDRLLRRDPGDLAGAHEFLDALHREVGVHGRRAVPDEERHVVHLAHVAGLDDQADLGAGVVTQGVVVHRGGEQQRRDRAVLGVGVAVREHHEAHAPLDRRVHLGEDLLEPVPQRRTAAADAVEAVDRGRREDLARSPGPAHGLDPRELVVVDRGERNDQLPGVLGVVGEQVGLGADRPSQRGDQFLADRVQRRVRDLREQLDEVVEEQARARGQHRDRRVRTHGAEGLDAGGRHRRHEDAQFLLGVPERLLTAGHRGVAVRHVLARRQLVEGDGVLGDPVRVRPGRGEVRLDLVVLDHAPRTRVDQEHLPRLQAPLAHHGRRVEVEHAHLAREDHQAVLGDPEPAGPQTVAVQHRPDEPTVRERHGGGAVPGLHDAGVELVERPPGGVHLLVVLPRLGDHHQHGVRERAAAQVQQFEHLVERRRVARSGGTHRHERLEVAEHVGLQGALARRHPVAVAAHRVDLTVVGHDPERLGQRPRRERVGGETRVDQRDLAREPGVREVREERFELGRGEHALVDDRARRERSEVHAQAPLRPLAQPERAPV